MSNFMTKEDAIQIMQGISKKTPQGIMIGNTLTLRTLVVIVEYTKN